MNPTHIGKTVERFAVARLKWIQALACIAFGWLACIAWVLTCLYASDVAVALIAKIGML